MSTCYLCNTILNKRSSSREHIISNACGGRLTSFRLLCKGCNEKMGADYDSELAKQVNYFAMLLDIKRDRRRSAPAIEKLDAAQKSPREIAVERVRPAPTAVNSHLPDLSSFNGQAGRDAVNKSIAKSAIGFFIMKGGQKKYIHHLIPCFLNEEKLDIVTFHFLEAPCYRYGPEEVSHIIKLVGDPSEKVLYCYVELFNANCFMVRLNDHYDGPVMDKTYVYDLLQSTELKKELSVSYTRAELFSFFPPANPDRLMEEFAQRHARVMNIIRVRAGSVPVQ